LESAFTGESLTIPDFVRGTLFTEFGELLFYSPNIVKLGLTSKVGHFAKKAFLAKIRPWA